VLSISQVDHFRTFGFVTLPGFLGPDRTETLGAEVDLAIRDAYVATYDERVTDGIGGHYLPMASTRTPFSASLVCDDAVLVDAAEQLLGAAVLPSVPEGVLCFAEAGWHNDDGIGVRGVKFAAYFQALTAANGALRFVPCSQHAGALPALCAYQHARFENYPGVVVETETRRRDRLRSAHLPRLGGRDRPPGLGHRIPGRAGQRRRARQDVALAGGRVRARICCSAPTPSGAW
jgi:hypothetical protein